MIPVKQTGEGAGPSREDIRYLLARAEEELDRAQASNHPCVVKAHYKMAERYLDRVYGNAREPGQAD